MAFPFSFGEAGAMVVSWAAFFLWGAMSIVQGCFEEGLGFESDRDLRL